jgi:hypothetical protein
MANFRRKRLYIDPKIQGTLLVRTTVYWLLCLLTASSVLAVWMTITGPARPLRHPFHDFWNEFGPAFIFAMLMLPVALFDLLRLSNKMAGPIYRLRNELRKLAMGEPARPIELRSGDFGTDLAQEFNAVLRRVNELEAKLNGDGNSDRAADTATPQPEPQSPEPRVVTTADADSALELLNQI